MPTSFLDPIFNPLLVLPTFWVIVVMSFIITALITFIYKYTTNQDVMKQLKDEMKEFQAEMKELKHDPSKMMEVQKKAMATNAKYMGKSMKSTLFTFIPIILIFGWMNGHLAYEPIMPNQEFTTTLITQADSNAVFTIVPPEGIQVIGDANKSINNKQASWTLKGQEGTYLLEYKGKSSTHTKEVLITNEPFYAETVEKIRDGTVKQITINNTSGHHLNIFGWKIGWLGTYIIFSILFSTLLRKLFKVY